MVVDCGGGTVDITVHEMDSKTGKLKELFKATGGPYGSTGELEKQNLLKMFFQLFDLCQVIQEKPPDCGTKPDKFSSMQT